MADSEARVAARGKLLAVSVLALLVAAAPASAICASTAACLQRIEAAQREIRTLTARFVQTKRLSLLDEPLVSTGRFAFKAPDRVLWRIETPQPATVVVAGRDVRVPNLSARDRQALAMAPIADMLTQLGGIFSGSVRGLEDHFEVEAAEEDRAIRVTLLPRRSSWQRAFRTMVLDFAGPGLAVRNITVEDAFGDRLEIVLQDVRRNEDIADTVFEVP